MGLDQYIYAKINDKDVEVMYWRKAHSINTYMHHKHQDLEQGETGEYYSFSVPVTMEMLDAIVSMDKSSEYLLEMASHVENWAPEDYRLLAVRELARRGYTLTYVASG